MTESRRSFLVGLVTIVAVIGLSGLLIAFGELDWLIRPSYEIRLDTDNAAGLRAGSPVTLNGVPVGRVGLVVLQDDPAYPVRVTTHIDHGTLVPRDVSIRVDQALIGGSSALALIGGDAAGGTCAIDGTAALSSNYRTLLQQASAALMERFEPLMGAMDSFNRFSDAYVTLAEDLGTLVKPQDPAALAGGATANLHTATARLNERLDDLGTTLALADEWLGDETLRGEVRETVTRAGDVIDDAGDAVRRYAELADRLDAQSEAAVNGLTRVADDLGRTLEEVRVVAATANRGDGTVGQLLNNPDLYHSLDDAAVRLEKTLEQLDLLIRKIKAEGVPVDF